MIVVELSYSDLSEFSEVSLSESKSERLFISEVNLTRSG